MLEEHRKILVGLDLDDRGSAVTLGAKRATQQALWLAMESGASVRFMHSIYSDDYRTPLRGCPGIVHSGLSELGERALAESVSLARNAGLDTELVITEERPWIDITQMVLRGEVDMVLVGKRNQPARDGRKLGSTATKLVRKCPCPVWILRPEQELEQRRVLAASDLSCVGDDAAGIAASLSQRLQCELHVVHAWQRPMELQLDSARMSDEQYALAFRELMQHKRDHIEQRLPANVLARTKIHLARGTPADIILEAVHQLKPELLVMGSISRQGIAGLLLGSTAERMLASVDCSLLTIKPEAFASPITCASGLSKAVDER